MANNKKNNLDVEFPKIFQYETSAEPQTVQYITSQLKQLYFEENDSKLDPMTAVSTAPNIYYEFLQSFKGLYIVYAGYSFFMCL